MEKIKDLFRKSAFLILLVTMISGCKKAPINDDIQGFWILREFTTLDNGVEHKCDRLYYSIGRFVTEISERQGPNNYGHYVGLTEFRNNETQIVLKSFRSKSGSAGDDGMDVPVDKLLPFGINNPEETIFEIIKCNGKSMILESDYARLELEKF